VEGGEGVKAGGSAGGEASKGGALDLLWWADSSHTRDKAKSEEEEEMER
jgi:hypothetical protein